jgi:hypothetical protein
VGQQVRQHKPLLRVSFIFILSIIQHVGNIHIVCRAELLMNERFQEYMEDMIYAASGIMSLPIFYVFFGIIMSICL